MYLFFNILNWQSSYGFFLYLDKDVINSEKVASHEEFIIVRLTS